MEKQVKEVNEKIEFNHEEANSKIEQHSIQLESINRSILSLTSSAKSFHSGQQTGNDALKRLATSQQESANSLKIDLTSQVNNAIQKTTDSLNKSMQLLSENICDSKDSLKNELTSQVNNVMQETTDSLNKSMQILSGKIHSSENSLKNELTSQVNKSNDAMGLKISKLEGYIETLEKKIEQRQQTPITNDLPSGHRSLDDSSTSVQKTPVNLQLTPVKTYSFNQQDNKGKTGFTSNQIFLDNQAQTMDPHNTILHSIEEKKNVDEAKGMKQDNLKITQETNPPTTDVPEENNEETSSNADNSREW